MSATYKFTGLVGSSEFLTHTGSLEEVKEAAGFGLAPKKEAQLLVDLQETGMGEFTEPLKTGDPEKDVMAEILLAVAGAKGDTLTTRIELVTA